ncbi:carbohydrate esterase family 4 protein [Dacryopinax primogenitus]|uniref:chitin deacetylase n=1 Tax=Dacryopinax primogenitus (strain DJM 731) TaxID=1858805 RepID=M5FZW9_DACPD|nr:carbohydrate esterase family 4 protein [Dacryopinax primogenitus]EJT97057.1 carbohydrate esterase family 4 protein [Dacryopinax primogenitus]
MVSDPNSIDLNDECTPYSYQPVLDVEKNYPPIWDTATLIPGDQAAASLFASINASVNSLLPADLPHGAPTGNWTGVTYSSADPDCWWSWNECTMPKVSFLQPDIISVPEPNSWGYGFDDGPNCSHNAFYDFLQQQQQKATMFYIGSNIMDWPLQAMRAITDGHQVCVHTWSHQYMTAFTNEEVFAELYYTRSIIKDILGVTPLCWRPPYGDVDNRVRYIASQLNLSTIVWEYDTNDWREGTGSPVVTPDQIDANYQEIIDAANNGTYANRPGPLVLTHELTNFTMSEAIKFYPKIKAAFAHLLPIATALNQTNPYVEQNVTYPTFEQYISGQNASSGAAGSTTASGTIIGSPSTTATPGKTSLASRQTSQVFVLLLPAFIAVSCLSMW